MHLYIHIPFCRSRCAYCDFTSFAGLEDRREAYVDAVCAELGMLPSFFPDLSPVSSPAPPLRPTLFIGGGTPSLLSPAQLERIVDAASAYVPLTEAEVTIEANPGTLMGTNEAGLDARTYFHALRAMGITRLSLGVQSLYDPTLHMLGRIHTASEAARCFADARRAGFDSINLDMIFGLPGQTCEQWQTTLDTITRWQPDHLSLYSLILEEDTRLHTQVQQGRVPRPDDDTAATMYEIAMEQLAAAGYTQYEISNWARTGTTPQGADYHEPWMLPHACQHNLAYWLNEMYIGVGAAAHGHIYPQRYANIPTVDGYIAAMQEGKRPVDTVTSLTPEDRAAETMFMGLRLNDGVRFAHFRARCGTDMQTTYGKSLVQLAQQGLIARDALGVRLTHRGRMFGNQVFAWFA